MAGNAGFGDDPLTSGSYSELLFSNEISGLESDGCFSFTNDTPKMLCFGDYAKEFNAKMDAKKTGRESGPGLTCSKNNRRRNGSANKNLDHEPGAPTGSQRNCKKQRSDNSGVGGHAKVVKKEKLGERITALQQLVSPFGKTDTASVLHEALGYIRFLHDQVQVLCSPYLQRSSPSSFEAPNGPDNGESKSNESSKDHDLRNRGLCLVPIDLTLHVANSNGADLWSSAAIVDTVSSS